MQDRYAVAMTGPTGHFPTFVPGAHGWEWDRDARYARKFSHAADAASWIASHGGDYVLDLFGHEFPLKLVVWDLLTNSPVESDPDPDAPIAEPTPTPMPTGYHAEPGRCPTCNTPTTPIDRDGSPAYVCPVGCGREG